jgi:phenylpropionate dioxygenase-like ring-hydroxylating dioxygenase large terminal subunit
MKNQFSGIIEYKMVNNFSRQQALALLLLRRRRRKRSSFWVHPIFQKRKQFGQYWTLMPELKKDERKFFNYFRMTQDNFLTLLEMVRAR